MRIGHGYDVHRLVKGRKLIIGGVEIEFHFGLLGHSDADVLVHAIMDALLGAAGLGDIGRHFPDTDVQYKDCSSLDLLREVSFMLQTKNYQIGNIDATIIAQEPKMQPYLESMVRNIAAICMIEEERMNIKATTEEYLGFTGDGLGISAHAVCLLEEI